MVTPTPTTTSTIPASGSAAAAANSTATTSTTNDTSSSSSTNGLGGSSLNENDFLQLMMQQLQDQDPLDPSSDPTEYLSELAQFSALEQDTNISSADSSMASEQNASTAIALIGHTVTYMNSDDQNVSGQVQSVQLDSSGNPTLTVSGVTGVSLGSISEVS